jgi:hypothetical protein
MRSGISLPQRTAFRFTRGHVHWLMAFTTIIGFYAIGTKVDSVVSVVATTLVVLTIQAIIFCLGLGIPVLEKMTNAGRCWNGMSEEERIQVFRIISEKGVKGLDEAECTKGHHRLRVSTHLILMKNL